MAKEADMDIERTLNELRSKMELLKKLAKTGAISGPYKTRQLPRFARLLREPGPLPIWVRYRTRRELDAIERMEDPPRPVRRSVLFGLFAGWE